MIVRSALFIYLFVLPALDYGRARATVDFMSSISFKNGQPEFEGIMQRVPIEGATYVFIGQMNFRPFFFFIPLFLHQKRIPGMIQAARAVCDVLPPCALAEFNVML